MKSLDLGCWEEFKKKHKVEIVEWIEEQARDQGIALEDDTEIFYSFRDPRQKEIYFGKEAIDETIGHVSRLRRFWPKGLSAGKKESCNAA